MKKTETFIGFTDAIQDKSKIWKKKFKLFLFSLDNDYVCNNEALTFGRGVMIYLFSFNLFTLPINEIIKNKSSILLC